VWKRKPAKENKELEIRIPFIASVIPFSFPELSEKSHGPSRAGSDLSTVEHRKLVGVRLL